MLTVVLGINGNDGEPLEALVSIGIAKEEAGVASLVAGTRCGHLLTVTIDHGTSNTTWITERLGLGPVRVFPNQLQCDAGAMFATCDNTLMRLSKLSVTGKNRFQSKEVILPVNLEDSSMMAPPIHGLFAAQIPTDAKPMLLLLSRAQLYFTELDTSQGPVPRTLPLGFSPTRIIYSQTWRCLIVALALPGAAASSPGDRGVKLALINPDTGLPSSRPVNAQGEEGPLQACDTPGDRVLVLREWVYRKGRKSWSFIIVGLKSGKLLVVSVDQIPDAQHDPSYRRLRHSTRWRLKNLQGPVTAVVTDEQGFLCCSGKMLQRYVLQDRKLDPVKEYELESPAVSLEIQDGKLYALTAAHSLGVIDYKSNENSRAMALLHCEAVTRTGTHLIQAGPATDRSEWPISLVASSRSDVTGLWAPTNRKKRELWPMFVAELSNPIRKFARIRSPRTSHTGEAMQDSKRFGCLPSTADNAEILGVSLDGKLRQFKLLSIQLWEVLNIIQILAGRTLPKATFGSEQERDPEEEERYHIDGDILVLLLEKRELETTLSTDESESLLEALERLDGGVHVEKIRSEETWDLHQACELCYTIIEHLLSPVI